MERGNDKRVAFGKTRTWKEKPDQEKKVTTKVGESNPEFGGGYDQGE